MEKINKKAQEYIYLYLELKMEELVGIRGTLGEITQKLQKLAVRDNVCLEPFEESYGEVDFGYNINLGEIDDTYFDFEVFMLKTNNEDIYLITEINRF